MNDPNAVVTAQDQFPCPPGARRERDRDRAIGGAQPIQVISTSVPTEVLPASSYAASGPILILE